MGELDKRDLEKAERERGFERVGKELTENQERIKMVTKARP
jgi:hypothetical protein